MNKAELDQSLGFLNNPQGELQVIVYACLSDNNVKKIDIAGDNLPAIRQLFADSVNRIIVGAEDYSVISLAAADERGRCFYLYDLELPEELHNLERVIGNDELELYNFANGQFTDIKSLIIVLADNDKEIALYKKLSPLEILGRGRYALWPSNGRFELFDKNLLGISPGFQAMRVDGQVVIVDLNRIERSFGFRDVIVKEASKGLDVIERLSIVHNMDVLREMVDDVSFARKLIRVARNSPVVIHAIPNADIILFSKTHPAVKDKMRYSPDESQFSLDTKVSKDLFMKLLNDDFLTSELTRLYYDSLAKDSIEIEEEIVVAQV